MFFCFWMTDQRVHCVLRHKDLASCCWCSYSLPDELVQHTQKNGVRLIVQIELKVEEVFYSNALCIVQERWICKPFVRGTCVICDKCPSITMHKLHRLTLNWDMFLLLYCKCRIRGLIWSSRKFIMRHVLTEIIFSVVVSLLNTTLSLFKIYKCNTEVNKLV